MEEVVKYLRALTFLQVQQMTSERPFAKPEVLLAKAGLAYREIADLLGKTEGAVKKAVQRAG